jgi:hypothetical protein
VTSRLALLELRHQDRWRSSGGSGLSLKSITVMQLRDQKDDPQDEEEQKERGNAYVRGAAGANGIGLGDLSHLLSLSGCLLL